MLAGPALVVRAALAPNSFSEPQGHLTLCWLQPPFPLLYTGAVVRHRPVWFNASWGLGEEGPGFWRRPSSQLPHHVQS